MPRRKTKRRSLQSKVLEAAEILGVTTLHKRINTILFELGALRRDLEIAGAIKPRRGSPEALKSLATRLYATKCQVTGSVIIGGRARKWRP